MMHLGVNIDHVATVRQARYRDCDHGEPHPVAAARAALEAGAHGITAHLREDRRHMIDRDIFELREAVDRRFNLELGNAEEIIRIALRVKPDIVCLVPENRQEITTEGGLNVASLQSAIEETRRRMNDAGIEVSLFVDPEPAQIEAAAKTGAQFVELHTGAFAEAFRIDGRAVEETEALKKAAEQAHQLGLQVNAGHGLNYVNLGPIGTVAHLKELNIGHSIVSRAVLVGMSTAVKEMLELMRQA